MVLLAIAVAMPALAKKPRDPCRGKEKVDEATGEAYIQHRDYWDSWVIRHDRRGTRFDVGVITGGVHRSTLPAGHPLELRLEDGTVVTLTSTTSAAPVASSNSYGARTKWTMRFQPTAEQVGKLARSRILSVHTPLTSGTFEEKLDSATSRRVQPAFECVQLRR